MKIGYEKSPKPRVNFDSLYNGDLFDYHDEFYMKIPLCKVSDSDGSLVNRNAVCLLNGALIHFCSLDMVTPVEYVGYAKVREDKN